MAHIKEESLRALPGGGPEFFDLPSERRGIVYDVTLDSRRAGLVSVRRLSPSAPRLTGRIFRGAWVETVVMGVGRRSNRLNRPAHGAIP